MVGVSYDDVVNEKALRVLGELPGHEVASGRASAHKDDSGGGGSGGGGGGGGARGHGADSGMCIATGVETSTMGKVKERVRDAREAGKEAVQSVKGKVVHSASKV